MPQTWRCPVRGHRLPPMHPRLVDARALVTTGAVARDADGYRVSSGDVNYMVRQTPTGYRCTRPWFGKHRDDRGPCKHVLAVEQVARN